MHVNQSLAPGDDQRQQDALATMSSYLEAVANFQATKLPASGSFFSLATKANGGTWWREVADLALAASFDHLWAFHTLLRGPLPRQAGYTVLRGSAEAAAIAWWVFDPGVPEQQRVHRGFEERLYGIHSQRGLIGRNKDRLETQHQGVVNEAAKFGLAEEPDSRREGLTHFGRPRLGTQDLLVRVLPEKPLDSDLSNGEILWRILSAFSHSELWTNLVGLSELEDDSQPRMLMVHMPWLMRLCDLTVAVHDRAFDRRMQLAGHATWTTQRGSLPRF
jgi:hypothetical protein